MKYLKYLLLAVLLFMVFDSVSAAEIDDLNFCVSTSSMWQLVGYALFVLKVLIPLLVILLAIVDLVKAIMDDDVEIADAAKALGSRLIFGIAIFFVPLLVSVALSFIKSAAPFLESMDACQTCLLNPTGEVCNDYKTEAALAHEANLEEERQPNANEVTKGACYYCKSEKKYVWSEKTLLNCTKQSKYTDQSSCESALPPEYNTRPGGTGVDPNSDNPTEKGNEITFNSGSVTLDLTGLSCDTYFLLDNKVYATSPTAVNGTIHDELMAALEASCQYLIKNKDLYYTSYIVENNLIYKYNSRTQQNEPWNYYSRTSSGTVLGQMQVPFIWTAGIYNSNSSVAYPHHYGMGIDIFSNWSYYDTETGIYYNPYSSQGNDTFNRYKKFICEVCDGDESCDENLNYQLYYNAFKQYGFCWGGNWRAGKFDPMHYEFSKYDNGYCDISKESIVCD